MSWISAEGNKSKTVLQSSHFWCHTKITSYRFCLRCLYRSQRWNGYQLETTKARIMNSCVRIDDWFLYRLVCVDNWYMNSLVCIDDWFMHSWLLYIRIYLYVHLCRFQIRPSLIPPSGLIYLHTVCLYNIKSAYLGHARLHMHFETVSRYSYSDYFVINYLISTIRSLPPYSLIITQESNIYFDYSNLILTNINYLHIEHYSLVKQMWMVILLLLSINQTLSHNFLNLIYICDAWLRL